MKDVEDPLSLSKYTHFVFSVQGATISATPMQRGRGVWQRGRGVQQRGRGPAEGEGVWQRGRGVWQRGRGSGRGGGGSGRGEGGSGEGWLHSKVWTDTHMNAKGF